VTVAFTETVTLTVTVTVTVTVAVAVGVAVQGACDRYKVGPPVGAKERRANLEWVQSEGARLQKVAASGEKEYFFRALYAP